MKEERKPCFTRSCKMVLWPIRARVLFELFYNLPLLICILTAARLSLGNHAEQIETVSAPVKPRCDGFLNSPHHLHLRDIVDIFQNSYFKMLYLLFVKFEWIRSELSFNVPWQKFTPFPREISI